MLNLFRIDKRYKIKHQILQVLYEDWATTRVEGRKIGSIRISNITKIHTDDINLWHQPLISQEEITTSDNEGQFMMTITPQGRSSYIEEKYLKEGKKELWENIWDRARIIIPIISIGISAYVIIVNSNLKDRIKTLETQIRQYKK
jgi:hypothetical protein